MRHGETSWSLSGQHTGSTDIALTSHGEYQARGLGRVLQSIHLDRVLTSPALRALRAHRTCELAGFGPAAQIEPDLAEWDYGGYEGRYTTKIQQDRPGWSIYRDGCPCGEAPSQVSARADRRITCLLTLGDATALF